MRRTYMMAVCLPAFTVPWGSALGAIDMYVYTLRTICCGREIVLYVDITETGRHGNPFQGVMRLALKVWSYEQCRALSSDIATLSCYRASSILSRMQPEYREEGSAELALCMARAFLAVLFLKRSIDGTPERGVSSYLPTYLPTGDIGKTSVAGNTIDHYPHYTRVTTHP